MLDPQFRSVKEVPLEHCLCLSLQGAEQWLSLIAHQIKVTQHNIKTLIKQHLPITTHLSNMEHTARRQAIDNKRPDTPRKALRRAVQLANKQMRNKLYNVSSTKPTPRQRAERIPRYQRQPGTSMQNLPASPSSNDLQHTRMSPPSCHHPP